MAQQRSSRIRRWNEPISSILRAGQCGPLRLQDGLLQPIPVSASGFSFDSPDVTKLSVYVSDFNVPGPASFANGFAAVEFSIDCKCVSSALSCKVKMKAAILVSTLVSIGKPEGTVGHEQRHVKNYIDAIQAYVDGRNSSTMNGASGNTGLCGGCISIDAENAEVQIKNYIDVIRGLSGRHKFPEPAANKTDYELLPGTTKLDLGDNDDIPTWVNQALAEADQIAKEQRDLLMQQLQNGNEAPVLPNVGF